VLIDLYTEHPCCLDFHYVNCLWRLPPSAYLSTYTPDPIICFTHPNIYRSAVAGLGLRFPSFHRSWHSHSGFVHLSLFIVWFKFIALRPWEALYKVKDRNDVCLHFIPKLTSLTYQFLERNTKILWNLHHIMNVDRRRRFAFGVTIENTDTRIWFCCREMVFVTEQFDFMRVSSRLCLLP
jgi:hypothetical protein